MTAAWTADTTREEAARRAGGRRHYNAQRQAQARRRRRKLSRLISTLGNVFERGLQARLARALGVSRATICRDMDYLFHLRWPCPRCGRYMD